MFHSKTTVAVFDNTNKCLWFKVYQLNQFSLERIKGMAEKDFHHSEIYKALDEKDKRQNFSMRINLNFEIKGDFELKKGGRPPLVSKGERK